MSAAHSLSPKLAEASEPVLDGDPPTGRVLRLKRQVARTRVRARVMTNRVRRANLGSRRVDPDGMSEHRLAPLAEAASLRWTGIVGGRPATVPVDRLLLGGEPGVTARRLAYETGNPMRPSTPVADSPLVDLVRRYRIEGEQVLTDRNLLASPYFAEAAACRRATGQFRGARSELALVASVRRLVQAADEKWVDQPVVVRRVRHSDCYQVHHPSPGLLGAVARGASTVEAVVAPGYVTTPLQDLLVRMSWLAGTRQLYQPIDAPELEAEWSLVRQCTDRLAMMKGFLSSRDLPARASYLDVASCYGWFVAQMRDAGFDAYGVERDRLAIRCGEWAYGLEPGRVIVSDAEPYLASPSRRFDVVSCLSLLHHVVLAGADQAVRLLHDLDAITGDVLFVDTGEAHEEWLDNLLSEWDPPFVAEWLQRHSTFSSVIPLGTDNDRRPPNGANYGRTLFACVR